MDIPFLYILSLALRKLELYMPTKLLLPTREQTRADEGRESAAKMSSSWSQNLGNFLE